MGKPDTLFDVLYKASYRSKTNFGWTDNERWRAVLKPAKRFMLDDNMSTFLGELATRAFVLNQNMSIKANCRKIEHLRLGARLPSETTWIEYNLPACQIRNNELLGRKTPPLHELPSREGWLLQRHPTVDTAFIAHIVMIEDRPDVDHGDGFKMWTFPVAMAWTADTDTVLPWRPIDYDTSGCAASENATAILGYKTDRVNYVHSPLLNIPANADGVEHLIHEWAGIMRRMWALLATINDLPVIVKQVRQSKGFVGKGSYRKFLDHNTVTLNVPTRLYRTTARNALAMAHRRGGTVREHWRRDWRNPLSPLCDHDWGADQKHMFCKICDGRKIWVIEHVRGDTSVGFTTRDYNVTHDTKGKATS